MKRNRLGRLAALALTLFLALPIAALAWPGHNRDRGEHFQEKLDALELEPETRTQVESIFESNREQRQEQKQALREARKQMRELLDDPSASEAVLLDQADVIAELELERHKAHIAQHLTLRGLLTPEQQKSLRRHRHHGEEKGEDGECQGKGHRRHGSRR